MVLITAGFLKLKQTVMMEGKGVCVCGGIKGGGWAGERGKKGRTDKVGLVLSPCHTGDR